MATNKIDTPEFISDADMAQFDAPDFISDDEMANFDAPDFIPDKPRRGMTVEPVGADIELFGGLAKGAGSALLRGMKKITGATRGALGFKGLTPDIAPSGAPDTMSRRIPKGQRADVSLQIKKAKALYDAEKAAEPFYPGKPNADKREWYDQRLPALMGEIAPGTPSGMDIAEEFLTNRVDRAKQGFQTPEAIESPNQALERIFPSQEMVKYDDPFFSVTQPSKVGAFAGEMLKMGTGGLGDFYTDPSAQALWGAGLKGAGALGKAAMGTKVGQQYLKPAWNAISRTNIGPDFMSRFKGEYNRDAAKALYDKLMRQPQILPDRPKRLGYTEPPKYNTIDITPEPKGLPFNPNRPVEGTAGQGFVLGKSAIKKPTAKVGQRLRPTPVDPNAPMPVGPRGEPIEIPTRKFPNKIPRPQGLELPAPQGVDTMKPGSVRYGEGFKVSEPPLRILVDPTAQKTTTPKIFQKKAGDEVISPITGKVIGKKAPEVAKPAETVKPLGPKRGSQGRVFRKEPIPSYVKPKKEMVDFAGESIEIVPAGNKWKFKFRDRTYASKDKVGGLQKVKDIIKAEGPVKPAAQPDIKPDTPFSGVAKKKASVNKQKPSAAKPVARSVDEQFNDISALLGKKVAPKKGGLGKKGEARFDRMTKQELQKKLDDAKRAGSQVMIDTYTQALYNKGKVNPFKKRGLKGNKGQADFTPAQRQAADRLQNDAKSAGKSLGAFLSENLGLDAEDAAQIMKMVTPAKVRGYTIKYTDKSGKLIEKRLTGSESAVVKAEAEAIAKEAGGELTFFKQGRAKPEPIAGLTQKPTPKEPAKTVPNVKDQRVELTVEEKGIINNYRKTVGQVSEYLNTGERSADLLKIASGKLRQGGKLNIPDDRVKLVERLLERQEAMASELVTKYGKDFRPKLSPSEKTAWKKLDNALDRANISLEQRIRNRYISDKPVAEVEANIGPDTEFSGLGVVKSEGVGYVPKKNIVERSAAKAQENVKKIKGISGLGAKKPIAAPTKATVYARPSKTLGKKAIISGSGSEGVILDVSNGRYKILVGKRARWYSKDKFTVPQGQKALGSAERTALEQKYAPTKGSADLGNKGVSKAQPQAGRSFSEEREMLEILKENLANTAKDDVVKQTRLKELINQTQRNLSNAAERIERGRKRSNYGDDYGEGNILRNNRGELNLGKGKKTKTKSGKMKVVPIAKRSIKEQMKSLRGGTSYIKEELARDGGVALRKALSDEGFKDVTVNAAINEIRATQVRQLNALRANSPEMLAALKSGGKEGLSKALANTGYDKVVVSKFMKGMKKQAMELGVDIENATVQELTKLQKGAVKSSAPKLQERVDVMNAALDFAAANPDSQLVKDTMEQVTTKIMRAVIREDVDLQNLPEVLMKYRDDYPGLTKYMVEQFKNKTTEAGQILNTSSQASKILNKMFKEIDPSYVGDIPEVDYPIWKSIMNGVRAMERERLTLQTMQLATGARNARAQQFRAIIDMGESLIEAAYRKIGEKITGIKVEGGVMLPFKTKMMAQGINAEYSALMALGKIGKGKPLTGPVKQFEKLLTTMSEDFPVEAARYSRTPIGSGGRIVTKPFAELGMYGKFKKYHNTVNVTQEMHFRRQAFLAKMLEYAEKYGTTIDDIAFWKANPKFMEKAVDHSLKMTFAEDVKAPIAQAAFELYKKVPVMSMLGHPYIRFFANAAKYAVERMPELTMAEFALNPKLAKSLADPNLGRTAYSKMAMGTSGILASALGLGILGSKYAGSKWYSVRPKPDKEPEKEIDLRGDAPLSSFLFRAAFLKDFGKVLWNNMNPKEEPKTLQLGPSDYLQGIVQMNRVSGTGLVAVDILRGDAESIREIVTRYVGQIMGGYTTWGRTYVDMMTMFDAESGKLRSTSEPVRVSEQFDKWIQRPENRNAFDFATMLSPIINNLPIVNKRLQPFSRATQVGEAKTESPAFKQFTGITEKKVPALQKELNRLNLTPRPKYGHPALNRRVNEEAVKMIEGNRIMESAKYKNNTDKGREEMLKAMFSEAYSRAYERLKYSAKDKHLFTKEQLKEKLDTRINRKIGKMAPYIFRKRNRTP